MPAGRGGQKQAIARRQSYTSNGLSDVLSCQHLSSYILFSPQKVVSLHQQGKRKSASLFCFLPVTDDNSAQTALPNGLFHFTTRPERASKCGPFGLSFGLSENFDGADEANKTDGNSQQDGREKRSCKAFSKDLIVRAIYRERMKRGKPRRKKGKRGKQEKAGYRKEST